MRFKFWKICSLISFLISFHANAQDEELPADESSAPVSEESPQEKQEKTAEEFSKEHPDEPMPPLAAPAQPQLKFKSTADNIRDRENAKVAREQRVFGRYDITPAMNRPTFTDQALYSKFYGSPSDYFSLGVDWYPIDWFATIGFGAKVGFYTDTGKTSLNRKASDDTSGDSVQIKEDSSVSIMTIPLQVLAKIQATPFRKKYVKLSGWGGIEKSYWRETKNTVTDDTSAKKSEDTKSLSSSGYKDAIVVGGAVHILLNYLDETTVASMQGSMGLGYVYLSPYYEISKQRQTDGVNFSRQVIGLGFTFESIH